MPRIYDSIIDTIGHTPLIRLNRLLANTTLSSGVQILAKVESFNPLGSVKDRVGIAMIRAAERDGLLHPGSGGTIIEASSGNTGIALAFAAAALGYRLILTMPENMSLERMQLMRFLGAELVLTPAEGGMQAAVDRAEVIAAEMPGAVLMRQFANPANPEAHQGSTAEEIWEATQGNFDYFIAGVGTGGSIVGCARVFKNRKPEIKIIALEPEESPLLSTGQAAPHRIQGIGANFIPDIYDPSLIDEVCTVNAEQAAHAARTLAKKEGILVGISAGAALALALRIAARPEAADKTIVVLLPDTGERYLSTWLFEQEV